MGSLLTPLIFCFLNFKCVVYTMEIINTVVNKVKPGYIQYESAA